MRARQRRLSLRFLSWFVLHEHIQTDTHDSIEDAQSALNLYKAYNELEKQGLFDKKLEELYVQGRVYVGTTALHLCRKTDLLWQNFKPPLPPDSVATAHIGNSTKSPSSPYPIVTDSHLLQDVTLGNATSVDPIGGELPGSSHTYDSKWRG